MPSRKKPLSKSPSIALGRSLICLSNVLYDFGFSINFIARGEILIKNSLKSLDLSTGTEVLGYEFLYDVKNDFDLRPGNCDEHNQRVDNDEHPQGLLACWENWKSWDFQELVGLMFRFGSERVFGATFSANPSKSSLGRRALAPVLIMSWKLSQRWPNFHDINSTGAKALQKSGNKMFVVISGWTNKTVHASWTLLPFTKPFILILYPHLS